MFHSLKYIGKQLDIICITGNESAINFFENIFTFSNESVTVHCCHPNNTIELATCGLGTSCLGSCSLLGAQLCPSGDCSGDCQLPVDQGMDQNRTQTRSSALANAVQWCTRPMYQCDVCKHRSCCYNPVCRAERPRECLYSYTLSHLALSSCPVPCAQNCRKFHHLITIATYLPIM